MPRAGAFMGLSCYPLPVVRRGFGCSFPALCGDLCGLSPDLLRIFAEGRDSMGIFATMGAAAAGTACRGLAGGPRMGHGQTGQCCETGGPPARGGAAVGHGALCAEASCQPAWPG